MLSLYFLYLKFQASSHLCDCTARSVSEQAGKPRREVYSWCGLSNSVTKLVTEKFEIQHALYFLALKNIKVSSDIFSDTNIRISQNLYETAVKDFVCLISYFHPLHSWGKRCRNQDVAYGEYEVLLTVSIKSFFTCVSWYTGSEICKTAQTFMSCIMRKLQKQKTQMTAPLFSDI